MNKKLSHLLCLLVATVTMISNANAQAPDSPNPPDLERLNLPPTPVFQTRLSSANDWEQIPYGRKLSYAFQALHGSGDEIWLTDSDLELIELGAKGTPPNDRYFAALIQACDTYEAQTSQGLPVDIDFVTRVFVNSDNYTLEDRYNFYEVLFNQMSIEGKELLLDKIEAARNTNHISTSRIDWEIVGQTNPNRLRAAFVSSCESLDSKFEAYEFDRANPGARTLQVPITGKETFNENQ
ncbi:MAG: hypothetical protein WDZ76_07710 [Pseudohongiellaceae bacterium]